MKHFKEDILNNICYTKLVYERINKKLNLELSKPDIEAFILAVILETDEPGFQKKGKNIYITNTDKKIILTINSNTNRIITVDQLKEDPII